MLGCRIGHNVSFNTAPTIELDLLTIGDNSIIDRANLVGHHFDNGKLELAPVKIGKDCKIGPGTILLPGTVVGDNVQLGPLSVTRANQTLQPNSTWIGAPAKRVVKAKSPRS
jgi:acetyltransferase-like isoleucine patch superfamily enzyme